MDFVPTVMAVVAVQLVVGNAVSVAQLVVHVTVGNEASCLVGPVRSFVRVELDWRGDFLELVPLVLGQVLSGYQAAHTVMPTVRNLIFVAVELRVIATIGALHLHHDEDSFGIVKVVVVLVEVDL